MPMTLPRRLAAFSATALLGAALLGTAGCASPYGDAPPDGGGQGGGWTVPAEPPDAGPAPESTAESETAVAVVVADRYWARHWNEFFAGEYTSPLILGPYDASNAPTCGDGPVPANNAVYCPGADYIAWDPSLMESGYRVDDAIPGVIVLHEFGHAVQARIDPGLVSEAEELQADCLAGATLAGAVQDGDLVLEDGDLPAIAAAVDALGDDVPWTNRQSHGSGRQRTDWFSAGYRGGVVACFPNAT